MTVRRVLLVCSGNTCRSPMAAAMLRQLWQKAPAWPLDVGSAGTGAVPGITATEHAVTAMNRRGLDITPHRSRTVDDHTLAGVDLVLTMTGRHKDYILLHWPQMKGKVYTLGEYARNGGDVADPFGGDLAQYETTAGDLEKVLQAVVDRIRKEGDFQP